MFPDGSEYLDAPVRNWDLMGDLAVIGPLDSDISPLPLLDGEDLIIGSDLFLIGYPGEAEEFPQPTISKGLLSRLRQWDAIEITYFQTDAAVAGGQSGGVLVSEKGKAIGITGLLFTEAQFGLVASSADILPRIDALIAGQDVAGIGDRKLPMRGGQLEHNISLEHDWDSRVYVVNEPIGTDVSIRVEGDGDVGFTLFDVYAIPLLDVNEGTFGVEFGTARTEFSAPYLVWVWKNGDKPADFIVSSNRNLALLGDQDDGRRISLGQTLGAALDQPADLDYFLLDLAEGDTVEITVDSLLINPFLAVRYIGATDLQVIIDDDSGGGVFGLNSKITYRAPHTGTYFIGVLDAEQASVGGYLLTVAEASAGAIAVSPPASAPTVDSPFGAMAIFEHQVYPMSIQYPADWQEITPNEADSQFSGGQSEEFAVAIDATSEGQVVPTLGEWVDDTLSLLSGIFSDIEISSRRQSTTAQGVPVEIVEYTLLGGLVGASQLFSIYEQLSITVSYTADKARHEELKDLIDYSFNTP